MIWLKPFMMSLGIGGVVSFAVYALMEARDDQQNEGSSQKKKQAKDDGKKEKNTGIEDNQGISVPNKNSEYFKKLHQSAHERSSQRTDRILPTGNWRAK